MPVYLPRRPIAAFAVIAALGAAQIAAAPAFAQQTGDQTAAPAEAAPLDISMVVATVNGTNITLGEVILMQANLPDQYRAMPDEQLYTALVEQIVTQTVLADQAIAAGLDKAPLAALRAKMDARNYLAEAQLRRVVEAAVTDEALRAAYDEAVAAFVPVEEIRASHILSKTEDEAKAIVAELEAGADFADLAKERSTGPSGAGGGDLGWFARGAMVPEFAEAAFALDKGDVSAPVQTKFGWHVILLEDRRETEPPSFEQMRNELTQKVSNGAAETAVTAARAGAEVTRPDPQPAAAAIRREELLLPN